MEAEAPDAMRYINSLAQSEDGATWEVKVYLVEGAGGGRAAAGKSQQYLFAWPVDQLPDLEDQLADTYPEGGRFRVMARRDTILVRSFMLEIARRPGYKPQLIARYQDPQQQQPPAPADRTTDIVALMMQRMEESARESREFMVLITQRLTAAPPPASVENQLTSTLALFKQFQEMSPKANPDLSLKMLEQGMELGKKIAGGGGDNGGGAGLLDVIKAAFESDIGKSLATTLIEAGKTQQQQNNRPLTNPQLIPAPVDTQTFAPAPQHQQPAPAPAAEAQRVNSMAQMQEGITFLIGKAETGADPELLADQVLAMLPPEFLEAIEEAPSGINYLVTMFPQVNAQRAWFERLIDCIFEEDNSPELRSGAGA